MENTSAGTPREPEDRGEAVGTLVILGATGDLTSRLLLPGLGRLLTEQPQRRLHLIGSDLV